MKRPTTNAQQDCFPRKTDSTISISWAEGSKSSVQPSSNGSWVLSNDVFNLDAELFPRIHWTGCAAGINRLQSDEPRNAPSVTETCNQHHWSDARHRCLEPNHQFSSGASYDMEMDREKIKKRHKFRSWLIGASRSWRVHWSISESGWDDSLFVEKTSSKRVPTVAALATLHEVFHDLEV